MTLVPYHKQAGSGCCRSPSQTGLYYKRSCICLCHVCNSGDWGPSALRTSAITIPKKCACKYFKMVNNGANSSTLALMTM